MPHSPLGQRLLKETCTAGLEADFGKLLYFEQCQKVALSGSKDCAEEAVDLKVGIQQSLKIICPSGMVVLQSWAPSISVKERSAPFRLAAPKLDFFKFPSFRLAPPR